MQYFPLFLNLEDKPVLVVGGGEVASRKVEALLKAGARVTVLSPDLSAFLRQLYEQRYITWLQEDYDAGFLMPAYIQVWATTDDSALNHQIYHDAKQHRILVNVVDDQPYCDFITPAIIVRGGIQIAISSGGASPVLIRNLRESIESILPQNLSLLATFAGGKRDDIQTVLPEIRARRQFWERFFADKLIQEATQVEQLEDRYQVLLSEPYTLTGHVVWIIFDPDIELIPIKALRYMQQSELILYPAHTDQAVLDLCRRDADRTAYQDDADLANLLISARSEPCNLGILVPAVSKEQYRHLIAPGDRCFEPAVYLPPKAL
jgi:precorrin-2 dehydrogenase/sirohydrochlorin ferrochelatase